MENLLTNRSKHLFFRDNNFLGTKIEKSIRQTQLENFFYKLHLNLVTKMKKLNTD